jgi:hypothetical protein
VLGAVPGAGGVVEGRDMHTWVEVHLADGQWHSIPRSVFMPPVTKAPDKQPPDTVQDANAAVVPPPNPVRPHAALDQAAQDDALSHVAASTPSGTGFEIPGIIVAAFKWVGIPALIVALLCAVIVGLKARRRKHRRSTGRASTRVVQGWNELVDRARDLGTPMAAGGTRREEATHLEQFGVVGLARDADAQVFGADEPSEETAEAYWTRVDDARRGMTEGTSRWQRWRAAVSLRSFLPRQGPGGATAP